MSAITPTAPPAPTTPERRRGARPALLAGLGVLAGIVLAVVWSYEFVDGVIGDNVANGVLGQDAKHATIGGIAAGAAFAFVSGFAGTFTACNIAVFGALPQLADAPGATRARAATAARAMGWFIVGMLAVAATYGVVAVLAGDRLPQLSNRVLGGGMPERLLQSSIVFGVIGLAFAYLGLTALRLVPDPLATRPRARLLILGALVGGFLVGRPYPLFRNLVDYAVATNNPLYGALTFVLQSLGNVLLVAVLAALLVFATRWAPVRRLLGTPETVAKIAGVALVALGVFQLVYWDVRLPAMFGYGWFPTMPWN